MMRRENSWRWFVHYVHYVHCESQRFAVHCRMMSFELLSFEL
ncbi:MAG TPA: hypothetical protein VM223_19170 [Planctomycetota bacterium]|nr:hypothetical protein [Planctomycetota bacterium]